MFYGFQNVESFDLRGLKLIKGISRHDRISTKGMFFGCESVVSFDLGGLNEVKAADMEKMFSGRSKLASLNLDGCRASNANTQDMFRGTRALKDITLGKDFHIKGDAKFEDAGSSAGSHWTRVTDGTVENPRDQVFVSVKDLANFHHDRTKRQTDERYARVIPTLVIAFDKGPDDVTGTMEPQSFVYNEEKPLTKNTYQRGDYEFNGWKDSEGNSYTDGTLMGNFSKIGARRQCSKDSYGAMEA